MEELLRPYLVVDTREQATLEAVHATISDEYLVYEKMITIGDYQICFNNTVIACIERKTYQDFASSFIDGRYKNMEKMIKLRNEVACQLFLFLEGIPYQDEDRRYGAIPVSSINTACDNMMINDNIFIIHTRDQLSTAKHLYRLLKAYEKAEKIGGAVSDKPYDLPPETLQKAPIKEYKEQAAEMWGELPNIGAGVLGRLLAEKYVPADFITGRKASEINDIVGFNGRKISANARATLLRLTQHDQELLNRLIGGIPGISLDAARKLALTGAQLSEPIVQGNGVTKKRAELINKFIFGLSQ